MKPQMEENDFLEGADLFLDEYEPRIGDIGGITANRLSGEYLSSIDESIQDLARSVNSFQGSKNPQLQGFVQEALQPGTFNVDAAAKQTGESAWRLGSTLLGSADIVTSWNEDFGLKYYKSSYGSAHAQTTSLEQAYLSYRRAFTKKHPDIAPPSAQEFLVRNGFDPNTDMSLSLYSISNQTLLCPTEQIPAILEHATKKIEELTALGDKSGALERFIYLKNKLTDHIRSPKGAESMRFTYEESLEIAALAREGKFDPKEYGITIASKADLALLWRNVALSGLNAAWLSALLNSAPKIVDAIRFAIEEGYLSAEDIRNVGVSGADGAKEGFIRGIVAAAITTLAMEGKLGKTLKSIALSSEYSSVISVIVVICVQTIKDVMRYSNEEITKEELAYCIDKNLFITAWSVGAGIAGQAILPFVPVVSYMLGSFIGSILGGIVYKAKDEFFMGLAVSHGYSFWGLVDQDYHMPKELAERLGYEYYEYESFDYAAFPYEQFPYEEFKYAEFDYAKLEFSYPERGVIGIRKVGYL